MITSADHKVEIDDEVVEYTMVHLTAKAEAAVRVRHPGAAVATYTMARMMPTGACKETFTRYGYRASDELIPNSKVFVVYGDSLVVVI
jgi:hypothetical protein